MSKPPLNLNNSISENIYQYLRRNILSGDYPSGHRLIVMEIAGNFGVSQAPVREALERLKQECLISSKPNKGSVVKDITRKEITDVYHLREVLEVFAVQEMLRNFGQEDEDALRQVVDDMRQAIKEEDSLRIVETDCIFHGYFYARCDNHIVLETWNNMKNKIMRFMAVTNQKIDVYRLPEAHDALIDILLTKDTQKIESAIIGHMKSYKTM